MRELLLFVSSVAFLCTLPCRALTVADARSLPAGSFVTIGPVTISTTQDLTGSDYAFAAQDDSGGVTLYFVPSKNGPAFIATNSLVPGSSMTVTGSNMWYNGLYEIGTVSFVTNAGVVGVPAATNVSMEDLQTGTPNGTNLQSLLMVVTNVSFLWTGVFTNQNYPVTNLTAGLGALVRVADAACPLVGQPIPAGPCVITGIYSYYRGPQIMPLSVSPETSQEHPNIEVTTNFGFGLVYGAAARTLGLFIRNTSVLSNLVVSGIEPGSGDTGSFSIAPGSLPALLIPQSNTAISITYLGGAPGTLHSAVFSVDPADPTNNVTFWGGVCSNELAQVWINEVDYDTPGSAAAEVNEFVELCGPAGLDIGNWRLEFWYSPAPGVFSNYATHVIGSTLGGSFVIPDDTYVQPSYSNRYQGGIEYLNIESDDHLNFAARIWLKFDTRPAKEELDIMYGTDLWLLAAATLDLTEYSVWWSSFGPVGVWFVPDNGWWEGPTNPPAGPASGSMMCWDVEAVYTNGEAQLGSYSSKGGASLNRCMLDAANPAFAGTITTGGILSLRLYAAGPVAAAYRSMNYTTDPGVRSALYLDGAVPEPAGAGMLVLALMLALRRTNSRMQAGLYPNRERKPGMPADARIALE